MFTYLDSPDFLTLSLHLITITSTPIYCLGIYCILFKTPKPMKSAKWYLLTLHLCLIIFDITFNVLVIPYAMFPLPASITCGLLQWLGVSQEFQNILTLVVFLYMIVSNVSLYENRFYTLCQFRLKSKWRNLRWIWLATHYIIIFFSYFSLSLHVPDQREAREWLAPRMTYFPSSYQTKPIIVLAYDYSYFMTVSLPICLITSLEVGFFIIFLILNTIKQQKSMTISQKTYQMHRKFFIALVTQTTVPFVFLVVPMAGLLFVIYSQYQNQAVINVGMIVVATHGLIATVVMVLVHRPYRLAVWKLITTNNRILRKSAKVSAHG